MSREYRKTERIILPLKGMTCASCAATIEKSLSKLSGVIQANVNLASEKATVEYLAGQVSVADFKKAVESAGYHLAEEETGKKKVTFAVTGMTCASCVSHVEKALREVNGVASANVN